MRLDESSNRTARPTRDSVPASSPAAQTQPQLSAVGAFGGKCNAGHSVLVSGLFSCSTAQEDQPEQQYDRSTGRGTSVCPPHFKNNKKERRES